MKLEGNYLVLSPFESFISLKRKIYIGKIKKIEEREIFWKDEYKVRFGTFIPKIIRAGNFYKIEGKKNMEELLIIIALATLFHGIFISLLLLLYFSGIIANINIIIIAIISLGVFDSLIFRNIFDKKFRKEFCFYSYKDRKLIIIYPESKEYEELL